MGIKSSLRYAGQVLSYMTLPRVLPRLSEFAPNSFLFAQLMAQVFTNVRLLPRGHRFANGGSGEVFGVRDVFFEAAVNLKGGWRHCDQYIVFGSFAAAMVLLLLQFVALFLMVLSQTAYAAAPFLSMFVTSDPTNDLALSMLDKVFQIPGFFGTALGPATFGDIDSFARGMQELFRFYSYGMLSIALFIVLYYIFVLVVETAQTGQPFGKRFPTIYGPFRLIMAIILLLPLSYGYNTGQYLTLLMAKWGSAFATNGWIIVNAQSSGTTIATTFSNIANIGYTGHTMIASPRVQDVSHLINFFYLVHTCKAAYKIVYAGQIGDIEPYFVVSPVNASSPSTSQLMTASSSYPSIFSLTSGSDIVISFGEKNAKHTTYPGNVKPYCGQITIPIEYKSVNKVRDVYDAYFKYIVSLWSNPDYRKYGDNMAYIIRFMDRMPTSALSSPSIPWDAPLGTGMAQPAGQKFYVDMRVSLQAQFNSDIATAIANVQLMPSTDMQMSQQVIDLGWGGAGIWYNKIAEYNGAVTDAVYALPAPTLYPMIMQHIASQKKQVESQVNSKKRFSLSSANKDNLSMDKSLSGARLDNPAVDAEIGYLLDHVYQTVADDQMTGRPKPQPGSNDPIKTMFMYIYEQSGLMDIRSNTGVHPLAKLSMLGKSIINKTIISLGVGSMAAGFGGLLSGAGAEELGAAFEQGGGVLLSFASTGLVMGFVLYYLIPFFPFIYFFFAVGRWVKSIFEAMVAVPIWALGHLRLEGEGVGNAAAKGYFLLLEIMLRPIFTIFGLLASFIVFTAMVDVLDSLFDLVVLNVAGFDMATISPTATNPAPADFLASFRNSIDALFFTIFYVILLYMLAMSSFKLIDLIPNKLLRFLQNVPSFHDGAGDPAENLVRNTAIGGHVLTGQIGQAFGGMAKGVGTTLGKGIKSGMADKMGGPGG